MKGDTRLRTLQHDLQVYERQAAEQANLADQAYSKMVYWSVSNAEKQELQREWQLHSNLKRKYAEMAADKQQEISDRQDQIEAEQGRAARKKKIDAAREVQDKKDREEARRLNDKNRRKDDDANHTRPRSEDDDSEVNDSPKTLPPLTPIPSYMLPKLTPRIVPENGEKPSPKQVQQPETEEQKMARKFQQKPEPKYNPKKKGYDDSTTEGSPP